jgi:hypothetical protein
MGRFAASARLAVVHVRAGLLTSPRAAPDKSPVDRGSDKAIVDMSALRMREATFAAGVWLTYVLCAAGETYVAFTWQQAHRTQLAIVFGGAMAGGVVIAKLPREAIVRSSMREAFFLCWSLLDLLLITVAVLADGGTASPLVLVFFIPVVFSAMSYPLWSVAAVGSATVATYLALAATVVAGAGATRPFSRSCWAAPV